MASETSFADFLRALLRIAVRRRRLARIGVVAAAIGLFFATAGAVNAGLIARYDLLAINFLLFVLNFLFGLLNLRTGKDANMSMADYQRRISEVSDA